MKTPFTVGVVGHFGLAVRDPKKSAKWFSRALGLKKQFEFEEGIAVGNDNITIALHKGKPAPNTFGHMSFHLPNMTALRKALQHLKKHKVELEEWSEWDERHGRKCCEGSGERAGRRTSSISNSFGNIDPAAAETPLDMTNQDDSDNS